MVSNNKRLVHNLFRDEVHANVLKGLTEKRGTVENHQFFIVGSI
jgi:hypothetical protein